MILFREVRHSDVDALYALATRLNTLNLPADRERLEGLIEDSHHSFGLHEDKNGEGEYIFVMVEPERDEIIGSCMIIAQHGTYERPSVYFDVREEQQFSSTLKKHIVHQVLQLRFDYEGPTEIGGLILDPKWRGHPLKLGRLLSFVRFLYIGMHRDDFRDEIVAELLPPLRADGGSDLWDHLGAHFTGLRYEEADRLSRENVEFIRGLFPQGPLYTSLLPAYVRDQIGQVGEPTKPVERMLGAVGFRWDYSIDPFDGGPTFRVNTQECDPVRSTRMVRYAGVMDPGEQIDGQALVGFDYEGESVRFRAAFADFRVSEEGIELRGKGLGLLEMKPGESIGFLPMARTGGLDRLY